MSTNNHCESARCHIAVRVPAAKANDMVNSVLPALHGKTFDTTDTIYILDDNERLQGLVTLPHLLTAGRELTLKEIMITDPPAAGPEDDQEQVASLAIRHGITSVPVVDSEKRFLGAVPSNSIFQILRREHIEDMNRLVGIMNVNNKAINALEASPVKRLKSRLPWLLIGLFGSMVATFIVSRFEHVLESRVSIAFFIPAIVYIADAIGTQTETVAVRGLSLTNTPILKLITGEFMTGLLIGLSLCLLIFPFAYMIFADINLAFAVAVAVLSAGTLATTIGLIFPWLLSKVGMDPAFGSGPVATIIQDVLSLLVYFFIVTIFVI
ncbi:MAG: magnesium transporter [Deltaproteobacteria bacterium]|nr:magnesium transporter [Deltaproteobacteria bacterium]